MKRIIAILALIALTGCSTIVSRSSEGGHAPNPFAVSGIYPATRMDALYIAAGVSSAEGWWLAPMGLFEMPISLTFDTILIPYDLLRE